MYSKFSKTDNLFFTALSAGLLLYLFLIFAFPFLYDEYFYVTIPFRLLQGDSLFQQEWHLSQMSSLFTFLPVWVWSQITGSADGILIFLRCVFLGIYTAAALVAYRFLRKYGKWAVASVILFFTQTPYRLLCLNYNSVYAICTLFLGLCLLAVSAHPTPRTAFAAGLCAGCCCVCNPLFVGVYILYLLLFVLRTAGRRIHGGLFRKDTVAFSFYGICTVAAIMVLFFFLTGGSAGTAIGNLPLILQSSEYGLSAGSLLEKLKTTYAVFSNINLNMPYLLPMFYLAMLADPKRHTYSHRCLYLILALICGCICIAGIFLCVFTGNQLTLSMFFSIPLLILTTTCYILTKSKNRQLFFGMWIPCVAAACVQYIASNTVLTALGFVLATANVAGVLFARDLYKEMATCSVPPITSLSNAEKPRRLGRSLICVGLCLQLLFQITILVFGQFSFNHPAQISEGPCAGMYVSEDQSHSYSRSIHDLDYIRASTPEDAPLLIVSYSSWMYLYAERPIASYTTWFEDRLQTKSLIAYYKQNPEKIPQYIYVDYRFLNMSAESLELLSDLFEFTEDELSQGVLLTVESCKFQ